MRQMTHAIGHTAGCPDASFVQELGDGDHAYRPGRLDASDNGQEIGRELIGCGDLNGSADCARNHDISRITQLSALRLLGSQSGLGALGDEPAFLLGQRGVEVEHEWICVQCLCRVDWAFFGGLRLKKSRSWARFPMVVSATGPGKAYVRMVIVPCEIRSGASIEAALKRLALPSLIFRTGATIGPAHRAS